MFDFRAILQQEGETTKTKIVENMKVDTVFFNT